MLGMVLMGRRRSESRRGGFIGGLLGGMGFDRIVLDTGKRLDELKVWTWSCAQHVPSDKNRRYLYRALRLASGTIATM
jgi:hypothetical protein